MVLAGCPPFVPGWRPPGFFTILRMPLLGRLFLALPATRASVRMALKQFGHTASLQADRIPLPMIDWERSWQRDTDTMRNDAAMIKACGTLRGGFDDSLELSAADLARVTAPCHIVVGTDGLRRWRDRRAGPRRRAARRIRRDLGRFRPPAMAG